MEKGKTHKEVMPALNNVFFSGIVDQCLKATIFEG